jgi:chromosome segregation ATPase
MRDTQLDGDAAGSEVESVTVHDLLEIIEELLALDERRQETVREALETDSRQFDETREILATEHERLRELERYLSAESDRLSDLVESTDHLSVDQAVRHREQSIEKIRRHNEALVQFHDEMTTLLTVVEDNIDRLEAGGAESDLEDGGDHLDAAIEAVQEHNDAVQGLDKNLRILQAYLP